MRSVGLMVLIEQCLASFLPNYAVSGPVVDPYCRQVLALIYRFVTLPKASSSRTLEIPVNTKNAYGIVLRLLVFTRIQNLK